MSEITYRPLQWQFDVGEIVVAYRIGGAALAQRSYRAIREARKLSLFETIALISDVEDVIADNDEFSRVFRLAFWA